LLGNADKILQAANFHVFPMIQFFDINCRLLAKVVCQFVHAGNAGVDLLSSTLPGRVLPGVPRMIR